MIVLDILYLPKGDYNLHVEIKKILNELKDSLKVITINDILKLMNFPSDWYQNKITPRYLLANT